MAAFPGWPLQNDALAIRGQLWLGIRDIAAVFAGSWVLGMALAAVLLTVRSTPSVLAQRLVGAYVADQRNVPTLVQLMLW